MKNPPQGRGLADKQGPSIEARHEGVGRVRSILMLYVPHWSDRRPSHHPIIAASRAPAPKDGTTAQFALAQRWIGVLHVAFEFSLRVCGASSQRFAHTEAFPIEDVRCPPFLDEPDTFSRAADAVSACAMLTIVEAGRRPQSFSSVGSCSYQRGRCTASGRTVRSEPPGRRHCARHHKVDASSTSCVAMTSSRQRQHGQGRRRRAWTVP